MRPKHILSSTIAASFWLLTLLCPTAGQERLPNLEQCVKQTEQNNGATITTVTITDTCDKPIAIQFMNSRNQLAIQPQLNPGKTFVGEWPRPGWYMAAVCPIGYVSTVGFVPQNHDTIESGKYDCSKK